MLKYYDYAITFSEYPDEISLSIEISNCPCKCKGCSESYLAQDVGKELNFEVLDNLIINNPGITCVGFMGGDSDHSYLLQLAKCIHKSYNLKVGMYSGRDYIDLELAQELDYYKIGRFILPNGECSKWHLTECGPINFPWSNQRMFKKIDNQLIDITYRFKEKLLGRLEQYIVNSN